MKIDHITTEAELDAHLDMLQAAKQKRRARRARLNYYADITVLVVISLLAAGYIGWPWVSAGRSTETISALQAVGNLFVVMVVLRAFNYALDSAKAYRRKLHL